MENNNEKQYFDLDAGRQEEYKPVKTKDKKNSSFVCGILVGLAGSLLIGSIVNWGSKLYKYLNVQDDPMVAQAEGLNFEEDSAISAVTVRKLQNLENTIDKYFYLEEVTDEELEAGVYRGLLSALDDPYSEYYTAKELNDLMSQTEGIYYGIGAYVSLDTATGLPKISGTIEGSPAEAVQLRAEDLIYEVDGVSTSGKTLTEAVAMIKGEEGTEVVLTIIRDGESDYLTIPVIRAKVESPTVEFEMLDDTTAYIQITEFDEITIDQFTEALAMAKGSGMDGLILDLRANPGGSLHAVVEIAQMMLPEGLVVYTEDKNGKRTEYSCNGKRELEVPMVVLIDGNSASASEILAGAIQDYGIGTLVGTTTFGKGIVQQIIPFSDGSAVKLTISSYFTPKGRNIHKVGVEPDVVCEFDGEAYYDDENPVDNQLEKAREVLQTLK
ncbi:MAG: S41 family peptidase [Lachnospiraceae bacterium]|nr:S41 family peptidase [Lachnospiraceae bacterium]